MRLNIKKFDANAMQYIYHINRITTTKVEATYMGWLVNRA